jgi:hypothetical protein
MQCAIAVHIFSFSATTGQSNSLGKGHKVRWLGKMIVCDVDHVEEAKRENLLIHWPVGHQPVHGDIIGFVITLQLEAVSFVHH